MLLGDVLAVVASIIALGVCTWAVFVGCAFLFDRRTMRAQNALAASPGKCFWFGLIASFVMIIVSLRVIEVPLPLAKGLGVMMLTGLFALVGVGGGGLARLVADRIRGEDSAITPLPAIVRGSLYIVLMAATPVLGTLVVTPIVMAVCCGAAMQALFSRAPATAKSEV